MFFQRNIRKKLEEALTFSPVVLLVGARQTGKSTLMEQLSSNLGYSYYTFDSLTIFAAAKKDPVGFISGIALPAILDEVQRIPEIFLPIKYRVDKSKQPGLFALTGSANPLLIPRLGDSLVGRMIVFKLYPLSQGELNGIYDDFIDLAFSNVQPSVMPISKKDLTEKMFIGGYPNVQSLDKSQRDLWFDNYITTILSREVSELARIEGLADFPNLLRLLAVRAGTILNVAELSRTSTLVHMTLRRYLALLQAVFMIDFLPSWRIDLGKRMVKAPKLTMVDTGLLAHLLGINQDRFLLDPSLAGSLIENFVISELRKQATWSNKRVNLYFFRTHDGIKVDIIIEDPAGNIVALEVKSSETVGPDDFRGIKYMQERYKDRFVKGIVLYMGTEVVPYGNNLFAWPISSLWQKSIHL